MAVASAASRRSKARLAYSTRQYGPDATETVNARRDFAASRIEDHIRELIAAAPPLTSDQLQRIASLLGTAPSTGVIRK